MNIFNMADGRERGRGDTARNTDIYFRYYRGGVDRERIIAKLTMRFAITKEEAVSCYNRYGEI